MTDTAQQPDDWATAYIDDPAKIDTHELALNVVEVLEREIASIQAQIDAAQIEANIRPLSDARINWVKRASYAVSMRRQELHRVMQRDKELRGTKNYGGKPRDPDKKEANLIKQQRLADEVAIRRAAKQAEVLKLQNAQHALALKRREFSARQAYERRFVEAAKQYLPSDQFDYLCTQARSAAIPPTQ